MRAVIEEGLCRFNAEDITIDNDYIPDSDPDSDITVTSVQSGDISSLGEESGESGPDEIGEAEWSQNFGEITLDDFTDESGAKLPDDFDTTAATPLAYFELLFEPEMFELIATNTNRYAQYYRDCKRIKINNPNFEDPYWTETTDAEIRALYGVAIMMGINRMPNAELYFDKNPFMGNEGIKQTFTILRYKKLMQYLHVSDQATELPRNDPNYDWLAKIRPIIQMAE